MRAFHGVAAWALAAAMLLSPPPPAAAQDLTVTCALEGVGEARGRCRIPCLVNDLSVDIDGPRPGASCTAAPREVTATLGAPRPDGTFLGTMEGKFPEDPTRFEVLPGRDGAPGIARTPFGWFALTDLRREGDAFRLSADGSRQLPPTEADIRILRRAAALLANEAGWNKQDDRTCRPNPTRRSLFCALTEATEEVSGGVHYRQPALQMAREVLNDVGGNRMGRHRLMDWNNHPDTTLAEVHGLLREAESRLERRFR